jgi:hypothetical protein
MPDMTFTTRGHASVVGAYDDIADATKKAGKAADEHSEKIRLTAAEAKKLDRLQQDIVQRNLTAEERYKQKLQQTRVALAGHKDEAKLLKAETARLTIEYIRATDGTTKHGRALKKTAEEQRELNRQLEESIEAFEKIDDAGEDAFGKAMVDRIAGMGGALTQVLVPLKLFQAGLDAAKARIESARSSVTAGAPDENSLKQLAENQGEYDKLIGVAKRLEKSGAAKSWPEALKATFELASGDFLDEPTLGLFEKIGRGGAVQDIGKLARSAQVFRSSYGREESGDMLAILAKAKKAAALSPGSFETVLEAGGAVGSFASFAGVSDEESLAGIAVLAKAIGSDAEAGTALEAFITSTEGADTELGLSGIPLMERVKKIQALGYSAGQIKKLLGRKEAVRGYGKLLLGQELYGNTLADIQTANTDFSGLESLWSIQAPYAGIVDLAGRKRAALDQRNRAMGAAAEFWSVRDTEMVQNTYESGRDLFGDNPASNVIGYAASGLVQIAQSLTPVLADPVARMRDELKLPAGRSGFDAEERAAAAGIVRQHDEARALLEELRAMNQLQRDQLSAMEEVERNTRGGGPNGALTGIDE